VNVEGTLMSKKIESKTAALVLTITTPNVFVTAGARAFGNPSEPAYTIGLSDHAAQGDSASTDARNILMTELVAMTTEQKMQLSGWRLPAIDQLSPAKMIVASLGPTCVVGCTHQATSGVCQQVSPRKQLPTWAANQPAIKAGGGGRK
jgi:hypothetical protein